MKKIFVLLTLAMGAIGFQANAQVSVSFNIGVQPAWGPTGYDNAEFYYLPDAGAYYDVANRRFEYQEGGRWISGEYLPGQYRNMDLYNAHKVVINEPNPWLRDRSYRSRYARYRGRHDQMAIRDSHEEKYYQNPGHPQHQQWAQQHGNDNHGNNHNDYGHGNPHVNTHATQNYNGNHGNGQGNPHGNTHATQNNDHNNDHGGHDNGHDHDNGHR